MIFILLLIFFLSFTPTRNLAPFFGTFPNWPQRSTFTLGIAF